VNVPFGAAHLPGPERGRRRWNDTTGAGLLVTIRGERVPIGGGPTAAAGALTQAIYTPGHRRRGGWRHTHGSTFSAAALYPDIRILETAMDRSARRPPPPRRRSSVLLKLKVNIKNVKTRNGCIPCSGYQDCSATFIFSWISGKFPQLHR